MIKVFEDNSSISLFPFSLVFFPFNSGNGVELKGSPYAPPPSDYACGTTFPAIRPTHVHVQYMTDAFVNKKFLLSKHKRLSQREIGLFGPLHGNQGFCYRATIDEESFRVPEGI